MAAAVGWPLLFVLRKATDAELTAEAEVRCPGIREDMMLTGQEVSKVASVATQTPSSTSVRPSMRVSRFPGSLG